MKSIGLAAIAAGLLGFSAAEAMPAVPMLRQQSDVILARQGCGFGAHLGAYGGCRLNRGWRGHLRGAMGGAPRGCPPGTHPTGRGFCRGNQY